MLFPQTRRYAVTGVGCLPFITAAISTKSQYFVVNKTLLLVFCSLLQLEQNIRLTKADILHTNPALHFL
jgi:hypothetical protein